MPSTLHRAHDDTLDAALAAAVKRSRKLLNKRAMVAAAASAMPVPGLDWAVDAALLSRLIPEINREFGLTPSQLDQLDPKKRDQVQKAVTMVGSVLIGKFISRELVFKAATKVGVRMSTRQLAKFVPFAGQIVSAAVGYAAIRYLGEAHMKDCIWVARQAQLEVPLLGISSKPDAISP
ncbi:MAG: hypothetical protein A3E79_18060 [Burkholderiales bacterium RIFCSPHIGHO2_12_FULL_61_11]|nr:MAG: hypothetical protein A3E79_18060 [Burkholderiales bacterium RIFCSPHIGHO2_12_FULL_61_11]